MESDNKRRGENKTLTPSDINYYKQRIDSPSFFAKKKAVIAGMTAEYWMNKAITLNKKK
jgi:hypothetical protein